MSDTKLTAPTLEDIEKLANEALKTIPSELLRNVHNLAISVEELPDEETEREMELESPFELLGLYRGVDMAHQSVSDLPRGPDLVTLYRRPLLDFWVETGDDLGRVVRHVLIHEIGHHFGFSDDDMERLDAEEEEA